MRTKQLKIRMTEAEHARIHELAACRGVSAADLVRHVLLGNGYARRLPDQQMLLQLRGDLAKVSANINQIARTINTASVAGTLDHGTATAAIRELRPLAEIITKTVDETARQFRRLAGKR